MISFLIPFRDSDGTRTEAATWIRARWMAHYPDAEFIVESDDGLDPFNKSMAVNKAFSKSHGEIIVILDADTWVPEELFQQALTRVTSGTAAWVIPATVSWRLTESATRRIIAHDPSQQMYYSRPDIEQVSGVVGFCHVLPRSAFEMVGGMDERFRGWGGEDGAFKMSVNTLWGSADRLHGTLVSLWHDRPRDYMGRRIWKGQTMRLENNRLWRRYIQANGLDFLMQRVLNERNGPGWYSSVHKRRLSVDRATFRSTRYPALLFKTALGKKHKFVGGRLVVGGDDIEAVSAFANARPDYGIELVRKDRVDPPESAQDALSDEADALSDERPVGAQSMNLSAMTVTDLRAALKAMGQPYGGNKAQLQARLKKALE